MRSSHVDESECDDGSDTNVKAYEGEPLVSRSKFLFWRSAFLVSWDVVCPVSPGQSDARTSVYDMNSIER